MTPLARTSAARRPAPPHPSHGVARLVGARTLREIDRLSAEEAALVEVVLEDGTRLRPFAGPVDREF